MTTRTNPHETLTVRSMFGKRMENPAMSHPLVSLGPGAGYRTHIVAESDAKHQPEALGGLRVVSEIAAARLAGWLDERGRAALDDVAGGGPGPVPTGRSERRRRSGCG